MYTLSNDTLSTLSAGLGVLVAGNDTDTEAPFLARISGHVYNDTDTVTGITALFGYLGEAIRNQRLQARGQDFSWNRFGATAAYCFSFYGFATFFVSLILNRTVAIASSTSIRRPIASARNRYVSILRRMPLSQNSLLKLLRFLAVILLLTQVGNLLVALSVIGRNEDASSTSTLTRLITPYFEYDPVVFALDAYMKMPQNEVRFGPTSDMLWPLYLAVAYLVFVETFASAINNRQPLQGAGITLFELSLAIQEMSTEYLFLGGTSLSSRPTETVLIICLFAAVEQISNQMGDIFYANKYRLVPLSIFNICFLWYFINHFRSGTFFSFPGEIIITYCALVLTIFITLVCLGIFILALVTKGPRLDELNYSSFFDLGHEDYEFFSKHLNLSWSQDFYTAAINLGMIAVTLAGKSSYMTEYSIVNGQSQTWLDTAAWSQMLKKLDTSALLSDSRDSRSAKLSLYLRENGISGYGNVTTTPTLSMINGGETQLADRAEPSIKVRYLYMKETLTRFFELLFWPLVRLYRRFKFRQESQEKTWAQTPPFLRHFEEQKLECFDLNDVDDEELEENYAFLLTSREFLEDDESPDYILEDSDVESDVDLIDLTETTASGFSQSDLILNELMTTENLLELVQDKDVLEKHLRHENGTMTRSHFHSASGQDTARDDMQQLLSLLVEKRQKAAEELNLKDSLDDGGGRFEHLACVICQIEPREIITWPCKCFSICESCRLSLVAKGLEGCVCCRRDVEGVSRVFLP